MHIEPVDREVTADLGPLRFGNQLGRAAVEWHAAYSAGADAEVEHVDSGGRADDVAELRRALYLVQGRRRTAALGHALTAHPCAMRALPAKASLHFTRPVSCISANKVKIASTVTVRPVNPSQKCASANPIR